MPSRCRFLALLALPLVASAAACGGVTQDEDEPGPTQLRVVHASRDTGAVDVGFNGQTALSGTSFGSSSAAATVVPGTYDLQVFVGGGGAPAVTVGATLAEDTRYTLVVYGDTTPATPATSLRAVVIADDESGVASSDVRFQIFHAAPSIEEGDVYSLNSAGGVDTNLVPNLGFGGFGSAPDLPKAPYDVGFEANSSGLIIADFTVPALTVEAASVFIIQDTADAVYLLAQLNGNTTALICESSASGPCEL